MIIDVPSPIDLRQMQDARQWADEAMVKRPWRTEFFEEFTKVLMGGADGSRILELGSGPGFLAEYILQRIPTVTYVALDFSSAMHELARERLGALSAQVHFVERSFREESWTDGLAEFDFVITNQAVHELRHKRYAETLHAQVRRILLPKGSYLVSDHFAGEGGMTNDQLFMTVTEQRLALLAAGFIQVEEVLIKNGLALHRAA